MKRRRRRRRLTFTAAAALCFLLLAAVKLSPLAARQYPLLAADTAPVQTEQMVQAADTADGWALVLVNAQHGLPDDFSVELTLLSNGESVDSRMYPALQQMFDDMRAQGVYPTVNEGFRTREDQQAILDDKIAVYLAQGYSYDAARELALDYVAVPGTSEHELGLAVDVTADKTLCTNDTVYAWLAENAYRYGFILRYPADKESVTGIAYEPWHYRYVGTQAAQSIYEQGLCLEEYLGTTA